MELGAVMIALGGVQAPTVTVAFSLSMKQLPFFARAQ